MVSLVTNYAEFKFIYLANYPYYPGGSVCMSVGGQEIIPPLQPFFFTACIHLHTDMRREWQAERVSDGTVRGVSLRCVCFVLKVYSACL